MITSDLFFSLNNPVIFSVIVFIALAGLVYLFYVNIYNPLQQKHLLEKENLKLKHSRLMAMFAELDPEPLFRFDMEGKIIFTNKAGDKILDTLSLIEPQLKTLIPLPDDFHCREFIENGQVMSLTAHIEGEIYDVTIKGIPEAGFGQVYCNDVTAREKAEDELEISRSKLRDLSVHIQKVQENEKQKIARELHDNFGQILTSIKMNIEHLNQNSSDKEAKGRIADINNQLEEARHEIRELSYRLRPRVLDDFGLVPALKMLTEDVSAKSGIKGLFQSFDYNERLEPETETNIYRIVQEALNNMVKHSGASEFNVQLFRNEDKVTVSIDDDGVGFEINNSHNLKSKSGMGMVNMTERALSFNGSLSLNSSPGNGTEIILEIPVLNSNEKA